MKQELKEGKNFLQFGFLKALGQGLTMLIPLVIARFLSEELYASYNFSKMIVFFFSMLFVASFQAPFIVFANKERKESGCINKTFTAQLSFLLLSIIIFCVFSLILPKQIAAFAKISISDTRYLTFAFIGLSIKTFICNLFMGLGQQIKHSVSEFFYGLTSIILIFIFHFSVGISIRTALLVYPLSTILLLLVFVWKIDYSQILPLKIDRQTIMDILNFTKWQFLGATAVYFVNWGSKLVLRCYGISFDNIGVYGLGFDLFKGMITLSMVIGMYFLPFVSTNIDQKNKMIDYVGRKRMRIVTLTAVIVVFMMIVIPSLISVVYRQSYIGSGNIIRILLFAVVFETYTVFYKPLFDVLKMYRLYQMLNLIHVTVNLVLNFIFVLFWGINGAAIACLISYFIRMVIMEMAYRRKLKIMLEI